jgi:septum site-determining protein MinD
MGVYAFAGGKGGVGKTTTALNVGVALKRNGYDVIVVDADLGMTDLGRLMAVDTEPGIHGVLAGDAAPMEALVDGPEDIRLLPGQADLDALGRADPAKLPTVLDRLTELAEFVLVDTSAGLSHEVLVALGAADGVLLLTTPKNTALGDAARTAELADQVDGTLLGTVVTRAKHDTDLDTVAAETDTAVVSAVAEDAEVTEQGIVTSPEDSRAGPGYQHVADVLETAEFADDPVAAARSLEAPTLPDPIEAPEPASVPDGSATPTSADADADDTDDEEETEGGTVSSVISGLFESDESGF